MKFAVKLDKQTILDASSKFAARAEKVFHDAVRATEAASAEFKKQAKKTIVVATVATEVATHDARAADLKSEKKAARDAMMPETRTP